MHSRPKLAPLTANDRAALRRLLEDMRMRTDLADWEISLLANVRRKADQFGDEMQITIRKWDKLCGIFERIYGVSDAG